MNAAVSPWFVRARPAALGTAYNGASFAGLIFSPLWVALISLLGFPAAAAIIGAVTIVAVAVLAARYFARTPREMGLEPDGDAVGAANNVTSPHARPLPGACAVARFHLHHACGGRGALAVRADRVDHAPLFAAGARRSAPNGPAS